jgi:DNA-binding transcriptional LysR family regulator
MNIENIEAFVYVIHFGSFNKAADALFLSQPSVTARIQSLERELDCLLFIREGKKIALTPKGKQFIPYAQQILGSYQKGKEHVQQKKAVPNTLRIGCTVSVANYMLPELLPRLKLKYPDLNIKVTTAVTDEVVRRVLNHEADLGLVRQVTHPNMESTKFHDDEIRLFVPEGHPFIEKSTVSMEQVVQEALVFYECGSLDWVRVHRLFENLEQSPQFDYQVDNYETAKKLVLKKMGIGFLPRLSVEQEVRDKQLYAIDLPELSGISLQTNLIALKGEHSVLYKTMLELGKTLSLNFSIHK